MLYQECGKILFLDIHVTITSTAVRLKGKDILINSLDRQNLDIQPERRKGMIIMSGRRSSCDSHLFLLNLLTSFYSHPYMNAVL